MRPFSALICAMLYSILAACASAQPVTWQVANGGNGHRYEAVRSLDGFTWNEADSLAVSAGGHLVTITSSAENQFVFNLVEPPEYWRSNASASHGPWLGGYQPPNSPEPDGGWRWVTDEPFTFANWRAGEPNNGSGREDRLHFFSSAAARLPTWNDGGGSSRQASFVIEYPPPAFSPADILNGSVTWTPSGSGMIGRFTPNLGLTLGEAADLLGVDHFNWVQLVTSLSDRDLDHMGFHDRFGNRQALPFVDPPPGGYIYQGASRFQPARDELPFYCDEEFRALDNYDVSRVPDPITSDETLLDLYTNDRDYALMITGGPDFVINPHSLAFRDFPQSPGGDKIEFFTFLVGVKADGGYVALHFEGTSLRWETDNAGGESLENPFGTSVEGGQSKIISYPDAAQLTAREVEIILQTGGAVVPEPSNLLLAVSGVFLLLWSVKMSTVAKLASV